MVKGLLAKTVDDLAEACCMWKEHLKMLHHTMFSNQNTCVLCSTSCKEGHIDITESLREEIYNKSI